jgi:hypothetical protein
MTGSLSKHKKMKHRNLFCKSCKEWACLSVILTDTVFFNKLVFGQYCVFGLIESRAKIRAQVFR